MANRVTIQQLQAQMQQQQGEIQNLTAVMNHMAENVQATQDAIQQMLANQVAAQEGQPQGDIPQNPPAVVENPPVENVPAPVVPQAGVYTLEKFIKNGAKTFKGSTEPQMAEAWTLNILKSFRAMEVPEIHWVRLASCMLEDEAAFWWEAAQRNNFARRAIETITWMEFMEVFNVTYYPEQVREQKAREFSNLVQGDLKVREYEQKFIQLERFAPGLCSTERARTNKFVWGLRFALKDRVANQRPRALADAVMMASVSEEVLQEQYGPYNERNKKKQEGTITNTTKPSVNKEDSSKQGYGGEKRKRDEQRGEMTNPICPHCDRRHGGECWKKAGKCFYCKEFGHMKKDCPKLQGNKGDGREA